MGFVYILSKYEMSILSLMLTMADQRVGSSTKKMRQRAVQAISGSARSKPSCLKTTSFKWRFTLVIALQIPVSRYMCLLTVTTRQSILQSLETSCYGGRGLLRRSLIRFWIKMCPRGSISKIEAFGELFIRGCLLSNIFERLLTRYGRWPKPTTTVHLHRYRLRRGCFQRRRLYPSCAWR